MTTFQVIYLILEKKLFSLISLHLDNFLKFSRLNKLRIPVEPPTKLLLQRVGKY